MLSYLSNDINGSGCPKYDTFSKIDNVRIISQRGDTFWHVYIYIDIRQNVSPNNWDALSDDFS